MVAEARQTFREGLEAMPPDLGPEGFRLVLAWNRLEQEQEDEQAVRDLLPAAALLGRFDQVDSARDSLEIKKRRLSILQDRINQQAMEISRSMVGTTQRVLVEKLSKKSERQVSGRTENNRWVNFDGDPSLIGQFVDLRITAAYPNSLRGELLDDTVAEAVNA